MSSGMNHHSVTEITSAAMKPNGTSIRFMRFSSSEPALGRRHAVGTGVGSSTLYLADRASRDPVTGAAVDTVPAPSAGFPLGHGDEGRDRLLLAVVMVEHHDQLRHGEQVLEPLAERAQLDLAPAAL